MAHITLSIAGILLVYMSSWFIVAVIARRNDVADIAWGIGFVLITWSAYVLSEPTVLAFFVNIIITAWGLRLAWHIGRRFVHHGEDARYAQWRKTWRGFYVRSFLQVFVVQGFLLFLIVLPVIFINSANVIPHNSFTTLLIILGSIVWGVGFVFEIIADRQLRMFLADPKNRGQIMEEGLWRYSRHPNYFGEVILWWGIFIIALSIPGGVVTIVGPLTITVLILFVSGIPMSERRYDDDPAYAAYKKRTSVFIPLPPKTLEEK